MNPILHAALFYGAAVAITIALFAIPFAAQDSVDPENRFFETWSLYTAIGCICVALVVFLAALAYLIIWLITHA